MGSEIRIGRISAVDYASGMVEVTYRDKDDTVTAAIPMVTNNDEYRMPEVGQSVLTAHLSNGSGRAVMIGTIWNARYGPKETGERLYRKDLSRKKDAAFIRYSDDTGEYLLKAPDLHLNGINKVIFDGPEMEIAANISILLQTDSLHADFEGLLITGGETGMVEAEVAADVNIRQEGNGTEAVIQKLMLELLESLEIKAGTDIKIGSGEKMELSSGNRMELSSGDEMDISTGGTLRLSDGNHTITLEEIIEKLGTSGEGDGRNR